MGFLHPMTIKCSYDHEKVCTNIIHVDKMLKLIMFFFLVFFLIKKYRVFIIILRQNRQ